MNDDALKAYRSRYQGMGPLFCSEEEWCRLFNDGVWAYLHDQHIHVEPNWTGGPNKNRWSTPKYHRNGALEFERMHAFIRQQAEAGDELYERIITALTIAKLTEENAKC